jgi:hypothetical protein
MSNRAIRIGDGGEMKIEELQETPRHLKEKIIKE